jgi:hypothetical protein
VKETCIQNISRKILKEETFWENFHTREDNIKVADKEIGLRVWTGIVWHCTGSGEAFL